MSLSHIKVHDFDNWQDYYWQYQYILAKEYYIPELISTNISIENKKILDIGCGNGGFATAFSEYNTFVTGIEIKEFNWKKDIFVCRLIEIGSSLKEMNDNKNTSHFSVTYYV